LILRALIAKSFYIFQKEKKYFIYFEKLLATHFSSQESVQNKYINSGQLLATKEASLKGIPNYFFHSIKKQILQVVLSS
jgi:hypothetical protein